MFAIKRKKSFKKAYKRISRSKYFDVKEFEIVVGILAQEQKLAPKYKDHLLEGDMACFRECHIQYDLLFVYELDIAEKELTLVNIGNHSELFG